MSSRVVGRNYLNIEISRRLAHSFISNCYRKSSEWSPTDLESIQLPRAKCSNILGYSFYQGCNNKAGLRA